MKEEITDEEVESVEELSEGDEVFVSGNGMNIVTDVARTSWMTGAKDDGRLVADLEAAEGYRVTLSGSDGIHCRQGAVTVERVSDE
jgi:hypothetical protein